MLVASRPGSIGMRVPLGPVAELANPVNRPGTIAALGADQAQQPHAVVVWASADPASTAATRISLMRLRPPGVTSSASTDRVALELPGAAKELSIVPLRLLHWRRSRAVDRCRFRSDDPGEAYSPSRPRRRARSTAWLREETPSFL
jgi:hypothetical protein